MNVKMLLLLPLLACVTSLSAQQYKEDYVIDRSGSYGGSQTGMVYGVMAGINVPLMTDKMEKVDVGGTAGFAMGMMWGVNLGGLQIAPEIWYQHDKSSLEYSSKGIEGDLVSNSIEVPIVFGMKLGPMRLNVGPSFSLMSDSTLQVAGDEDIDFGRTKSTAGYLVGLSTTLMDHLILDVRYTGRFVSVTNPWYTSTGEDDPDYRYYSFGINVGYKF